MTCSSSSAGDFGFSAGLAGAIDTHGVYCLLGAVGLAAPAVEDIVRRQMDERNAGRAAETREGFRALGIHAVGETRFALGLVDGGIGRGVQHEMGGERSIAARSVAGRVRSASSRARNS